MTKTKKIVGAKQLSVKKNSKEKKIRNKNYHLLNKWERKNATTDGSKGYNNNNRRKEVFDNKNEREELQKKIDEELETVVAENKQKLFGALPKINTEIDDTKGDDIKRDNAKGDDSESKNAYRNKKNNLTIIDKNVLTDKEFKSLPISTRTLKALEENGFSVMTNIQAVSIPIVLLNKHIYAQAQTGTGKTLCFAIPLMEKLYRNGVDNKSHILEGLIISPTRELVYQIFEVLNMLNKYHKFNICCVIGGKNEEREKGVFSYANIVVCTPGRLLFHLENNYFCNLDYVTTLVIDEIDKLVDCSFYSSLQNILLYKPQENCQVCLFSATMCKYLNVILKTFDVKNYEYVSINDKGTYIENNQIKHIFIECSLYDKINYLYTFLFSKREKKIIVFFSTCKQVRFMFETFKKMKVGVMKFLQLHGKMKQVSRLNTYSFFSKKQNFTCLFTTDIGCRGLDFANVDWVIHFDVPENVETFIHRSGRTGRLTKEGNSLIFLTAEIDNRNIFLQILKHNNIEIKEKTLKHSRMFDVTNKIHSINAAFKEIKHLAQTALVNYLRHIMIVMKFKNVGKLDLEKLADAYGLAQFSEDMKKELRISDQEKSSNRSKPSRLQKFLQILKNKKEKKEKETKEITDKKEEEEEEKEKVDESAMVSTNNRKKKAAQENKENTETSKKAAVSLQEEDEHKQTKRKTRETLSSYSISDALNDENDEDGDEFFQKKKVDIPGEGLAMMPKKKKKRVKIASVLSNSVLYDDDCNEINAETEKIKFLIGDLENKKGQTETTIAGTEMNLLSDSYIKALKEEVEETNKRILEQKTSNILSDMPNAADIIPTGDQHSDEMEDECEEDDDEDSDVYYEKLKMKKLKKKMRRKIRKIKKAQTKNEIKDAKEDTLESADVTQLENEVLAYLQ